jgi:hypothetical protein
MTTMTTTTTTITMMTRRITNCLTLPWLPWIQICWMKRQVITMIITKRIRTMVLVHPWERRARVCRLGPSVEVGIRQYEMCTWPNYWPVVPTVVVPVMRLGAQVYHLARLWTFCPPPLALAPIRHPPGRRQRGPLANPATKSHATPRGMPTKLTCGNQKHS